MDDRGCNHEDNRGQYTGTMLRDLHALVDEVLNRSHSRGRGFPELPPLPALPYCDWCQPETSYGACDGGEECRRLAVVSDVESGQCYCLRHWRVTG
jgi:hypothetical protein